MDILFILNKKWTCFYVMFTKQLKNGHIACLADKMDIYLYCVHEITKKWTN